MFASSVPNEEPIATQLVLDVNLVIKHKVNLFCT